MIAFDSSQDSLSEGTLPEKNEMTEGTRIASAQNALFVALCGILLFSVLLYISLGSIGAVTVQNRSGIEGRNYTVVPTPSRDSLAAGSFQQQAEKFTADHVPARDTVIIANAALQRAVIKMANTVFGYDCYPTKFASTRVEVPRSELVTITAPAPAKKNIEGAEKWVAAVNAVKANYPDVRFVYDIIDDTYTSEFNPTRKYVSRCWTADWISKHMCDVLSKSDVEVIYDPIVSKEEFEELWFKTEHHWTLERALKSYNALADELGWTRATWESPFEVTAKWYGSSSRSGLDLDYFDSLYDIPTNYEGLSCKINGKEGQRGMKEKIARNEHVDLDFGNPPTNAFGTYFGGVVGEAIWDNSGNPEGGTCLFIEQSYGPPLEPYIARNYARTICVDPLNKKMSKSLSDYIEEYRPDVVVIQLGVRDLHKIGENSPSWM